MAASSTPLGVTLRSRDNLPSGLAPARPMRDHQAERRKALSNASKTLLSGLALASGYIGA
jgi:hypothetical protein